MSDKDKDPPIVEQAFLSGMKVVHIGDIRVARGLSRRPFETCSHRNLVFDRAERRVWCKDCEKNVDAFDAFCGITEQYTDALDDLKRQHKELEEAKTHALHLIACKNLEKEWRGKTMAIACPHCRGGLLPEDFSPIGARCSAEVERARRAKKP